MVPAFENTRERSTTKNYHPVSLLFVVNEVSEKLVNNRLVDHLEICGLFLNFQYGFRSFDQLQIFILIVLSDRIARAFNRSQVTKAAAFDISKAFDRIWHADLLHKFKSYGTLDQIFGLIPSFISNK